MVGAFRSSSPKISVTNYLRGPLRKRKFTSTGHCLWFVIGGFRSVLWGSVFQGSLLVILLWPKPDVNIPNIPDFIPGLQTSNFDEAKILKIQIDFWDRKSAIKCRVLAEISFPHASYLLVLRRSLGRHSHGFACLLVLFTLARIACLFHICVKTSRFHYSIWATPK